MASVEILRAARARIADPAHWTTGRMARDQSGEMAWPNSPDAVCWCAYGALMAESIDAKPGETNALTISALQLFGSSLIYVNDGLGHDAALKVYDHAIAKAEASV